MLFHEKGSSSCFPSQASIDSSSGCVSAMISWASASGSMYASRGSRIFLEPRRGIPSTAIMITSSGSPPAIWVMTWSAYPDQPPGMPVWVTVRLMLGSRSFARSSELFHVSMLICDVATMSTGSDGGGVAVTTRSTSWTSGVPATSTTTVSLTTTSFSMTCGSGAAAGAHAARTAMPPVSVTPRKKARLVNLSVMMFPPWMICDGLLIRRTMVPERMRSGGQVACTGGRPLSLPRVWRNTQDSSPPPSSILRVPDRRPHEEQGTETTRNRRCPGPPRERALAVHGR